MSVFKQEIQDGSRTISIETGKWARQAHGSIVYRVGDLILLATVCAEREAREGQDFFPLTVDYREKFYAAGRIPGGYFKREARPAEHETLLSRLIDRPVRPLFPEGYFSEVQLLITQLSADQSLSVEGHAITAASAALMASDIPFQGPIAGILVGRVDGEFVVDPSLEDRAKSDLDLLVAGSADAITMIEGSSREYSNEEMLEALDFAHNGIKAKLELQHNLAKEANVQKREVSLRIPDKDLLAKVREYALEKLRAANKNTDKGTRGDQISAVNRETIEHFRGELSSRELSEREIENHVRDIKSYLHELEYEVVRALIFDENKRADGRAPDEIRDITVELDVLPGAHGSSVFTRGQTQSLGVVTLGTKMDSQRYETLAGEEFKKFLLHYNFPAYSVGEVKRMMGPGRREIGHGNLAFRALKAVIPEHDGFPYTIRIVSEILESNGSSSMATVCSGSLALMAAGVPISGAVSGIAMGLMTGEGGKYAILSDIAGIEDHFGDMDFKVAGTEKGITAFQLDLKLTGISIQILKESLGQAERGRLHILNEMNKALDTPRAALPENAPQITSMKVDADRIGELIGPGGKIIRAISEQSGAEITVEDDGTVSIASINNESNVKARGLIENIFRELKEGETFDGVVRRIVDFGAFVELYPGKEGLLHISKMSENRISQVSDLFKEGDQVPVIVLGVDRQGRVDLMHKDVYDAGGGQVSRNNGRGDRDRGGDRGGRGRDSGRGRDRDRGRSSGPRGGGRDRR